MGFNLLMKRKVFARIQVMCDDYEDRFNEKVATASIVNVLLAEALITRGEIPEDFILNEYGCKTPIEQGFTPKARKDRKIIEVRKEEAELKRISKTFSEVFKQWGEHPDEKWREGWITRAKKWQAKIPIAKLILELENAETSAVIRSTNSLESLKEVEC